MTTLFAYPEDNFVWTCLINLISLFLHPISISSSNEEPWLFTIHITTDRSCTTPTRGVPIVVLFISIPSSIAQGTTPGVCIKMIKTINSQGYTQQFTRLPLFAGSHSHSWVVRGSVIVKCLAQECTIMMSSHGIKTF